MFEKKWSDGLVIREMNEDEFNTIVLPAIDTVFSTRLFETSDTGTPSQIANAAANRAAFKSNKRGFCVGAFYNGTFAGWHFGRQRSPTSFHMTNSAVFPEFRRKRIYERLLDSVLEWTKEQGYQSVMSNHHPTNNAIIIPKLKRNFYISGTETNDKFGNIITLTYYHSELARKVFEFRTGYTQPDEEVLAWLLKPK